MCLLKKTRSIKSVLRKEGHLIYPIKGTSMYPLLSDGDNVLISKKDTYFVNDVVLFLPKGRKNNYILHRIRKIEGKKYYIVGDNSPKLDIVNKRRIFGVMVGVYKDKKLILIK